MNVKFKPKHVYGNLKIIYKNTYSCVWRLIIYLFIYLFMKREFYYYIYHNYFSSPSSSTMTRHHVFRPGPPRCQGCERAEFWLGENVRPTPKPQPGRLGYLHFSGTSLKISPVWVAIATATLLPACLYCVHWCTQFPSPGRICLRQGRDPIEGEGHNTDKMTYSICSWKTWLYLIVHFHNQLIN